MITDPKEVASYTSDTIVDIYMEHDLKNGTAGVGVFAVKSEPGDKIVNGPPGYIHTNYGLTKRSLYTKQLPDGEMQIYQPTSYREMTFVKRDYPKGRNLLIEMFPSIVKSIMDVINEGTRIRIHITDMMVVDWISIAKSMPKGKKASIESGKSRKLEIAFDLEKMCEYISGLPPQISLASPFNLDSSVGSNKAGFLATLATNLSEATDIVIAPKVEYWKGFQVRPKVLCLRYMLLSTTARDDVYVRMVDPGNDIYNLGKRAGKSCYGVAKHPKQEDYCNVLVNNVYEQVKNPAIVTLDIDKVYLKSISAALNTYKEKCCVESSSITHTVDFIVDNVPLVAELSPMNMALVGYHHTTMLGGILDDYIRDDFETTDKAIVKVHDVTDQLYDGVKLKKSIRSSGGILNLSIPSITPRKLSLHMGKSTLSMNAIGQLGSKTTKAMVVAWASLEGDNYSHALLFDTPHGLGIYGNVDTNRIYTSTN